MKKCNALRNRLLPIVAIVAMTFAGSCSKDQTVEPDGTDATLETRATPTISLICTPTPKGENQTYLGLKQTYRFASSAYVMTLPGRFQGLVSDMAVRADDGSMDGYEIVTDEDDGIQNVGVTYLYVKFTEPGYYHVTSRATYGGAIYQETKTYCVVSRAQSLTLPETIELGVPFDLKFVFYDTRYPAPTIEITESLFNDPQCTVLENDDHGNFRLRIDQPGNYTISTGLGGKFSAWANINVYWRPEKAKSTSSLALNVTTQESSYFNKVLLCNVNNEVYDFLPYRICFDYKLNRFAFNDQSVAETSTGTISRLAGTSGTISMPKTKNEVSYVHLSWVLTRFSLGYYWNLTIPDDEINWFCVADPDIVGPFEPEEPGGGIGPLDPPGGGTIIQ